MANRTKSRLRGVGEQAIVTFIFLADPAVVELAALAGFDFALIDMEHVAREISEVATLVRTCEAVEITPIVRVHDNAPKNIMRVLDTGAKGVVLPLLENGEQPAAAVSACRYPPHGTRGTCTQSRAARYGSQRHRFAEFSLEIDDDLLIVGLIETASGVKNAAEVMQAGIDVAYVGRTDLAASMGLIGEWSHPAVVQARDEVFGIAEQCAFGVDC